jgi:flagellar hook-associated protein 3 FlgL
MRISTAQLFNGSLTAMLDNQSSLSKTQLQMSTGRRILTPADDPAGSAAILDLGKTVEATEQYQRNADMARGRLELEEGTLASVGDLLQRVRELAIQANNDSQTGETRRSIAVELRNLREQLMGLANTQDANGEYLFAGSLGNVRPFADDAAGAAVYSGDHITRFLQIGPTQQVADRDPGVDVFMNIRNGNGTFTTLDAPTNTGTGVIDPGTVLDPTAYVPDTFQIVFTSATTFDVIDTTTATTVLAAQTYVENGAIAFNGIQTSINGIPATGDTFTISPSLSQDVFATISNMVDGLETYLATPDGMARLHNVMNRGLTDLDQAMTQTLNVRARAGSRLNTIDTQKDSNELYLLQAQTSLSEAQDLDYAEAASRLNRQILALQAAQQTFVKVQGLSLFNFL